MKNIIYGGCNQQPNEKKLRIVWSLECEKVGFDLSHWWHSQAVQWGSGLRGSLNFGRERRNKKRNAILNF